MFIENIFAIKPQYFEIIISFRKYSLHLYNPQKINSWRNISRSNKLISSFQLMLKTELLK